jgi:hypothetical protein
MSPRPKRVILLGFREVSRTTGHHPLRHRGAHAWDRLHPRLTRCGAWADHQGGLLTVEGTLIRLQFTRLPGHQDPKPLWL